MNRVLLIALSGCLVSHCWALERIVPGEYPTIQQAIDAAQNGDVVTVYPGTYYESLNFRGKAITVRARDLSSWTAIQKTVISGHHAKSSCAIFDHGETNASVLEGFTLRFSQEGGLVQWRNDSFRAGGGILCINSSPTIRRCCIGWNHATYGGGIALVGLYLPACTSRTSAPDSVSVKYLRTVVFQSRPIHPRRATSAPQNHPCVMPRRRPERDLPRPFGSPDRSVQWYQSRHVRPVP